MISSQLYVLLSAFTTIAHTGFPSPPQAITTTDVPSIPGASISYKKTTICETKAAAYAGYVHLPASALNDAEGDVSYNISTFFWYFEARENAQHAQTAIYLAGGPGQSSMYGVTESGGPCVVNPDSNSTQRNPYSFNEHVNMLYVDQPVGSGFSYDALINSTQDLLPTGTGITPFDQYDGSIPAENTTFLYGTFPRQDPTRTLNTTPSAAMVMWHFSQAWFSTFSQWNTQDKRVSLWGNSFGGYWVPASAEYIVKQNQKIQSGELKDGLHIEVDTIGWTNGCTDALVQAEYWPEQAYNNTYGFEAISLEAYQSAIANWSMPMGCRDLIQQCRDAGTQLDPDYTASNQDVNAACAGAAAYCYQYVEGAYEAFSDRSAFDMAHKEPNPFPPSYLIGFFNRGWVQQDLGVPVNFTASSSLVANNFFVTGDLVRFAGAEIISSLLESGVKVAMIYGDRDYRCPWNGGEQVSLQVNWTGSDHFKSAGYESIMTSACYNGGVVRQYGNLTFSRVFEAGHDAAAYQPRTVFEIFNRAMFNRDIATGNIETRGSENVYTSKGPLSSFGIKNELPESPAVNCNLYAAATSCTDEQIEALANGTAILQDFNVIRPDGVR